MTEDTVLERLVSKRSNRDDRWGSLQGTQVDTVLTSMKANVYWPAVMNGSERPTGRRTWIFLEGRDWLLYYAMRSVIICRTSWILCFGHGLRQHIWHMLRCGRLGVFTKKLCRNGVFKHLAYQHPTTTRIVLQPKRSVWFFKKKKGLKSRSHNNNRLCWRGAGGKLPGGEPFPNIWVLVECAFGDNLTK